jgi:hypothetical protein
MEARGAEYHLSANATVPATFYVDNNSSCTVTADNCFRSANYPDSYPNNDTCNITVLVPDTLVVRSFNIESGSDFLTVDSVNYSGTLGPEGVSVTPGTLISWSSDHIATRAGVKICGTAPHKSGECTYSRQAKDLFQ